MAIDKVISTDLYSQFVSKYNATTDEVPVSGAMVSNGVLRITNNGGSTFDINIPPSANQVISGCTFAVTFGGQVTVQPGTYLIDGTEYTIGSPVVFNLDAVGIEPRIDVIVVNTSSTATFVKGTEDANPTEPSISSTELKLGIVLVNPTGYGVPSDQVIPRGLAQDVNFATTSALPSNTYDGIGKTLTALANGQLTIDGGLPKDGSRVLIKDESTASNNGIYEVTDKGSVSTPYILTRAEDFTETFDIKTFLAVYTYAGSLNGGKLFGLDGIHSSLVLDTNDLDFFHIETPFKATAPGGGGGRSFTSTTSITSASSPYTMSAGERVEVDCSGGNVVVNPPQVTDQIYSIIKTDSSANTIQVAPPSGTILGDTDLIIESQYDSVEIISNGTNMTII